MKPIQDRNLAVALAFAMLLPLAGCSGMSRGERTVVGAGVGAVGGAVLTDGHPAGTVGGAVVGGVIGNQMDDDDHHHDRRYRH